MKNNKCPHCKEEVHPEAKICKHCNTFIRLSREEKVILAIQQKLDPETYKLNAAHMGPIFNIGPVSPCVASCAKFTDKKQYNECIDNCKAIEYQAIMAGKMVKAFYESLIEGVWGGGDIDPLPYMERVKKIFAEKEIPYP